MTLSVGQRNLRYALEHDPTAAIGIRNTLARQVGRARNRDEQLARGLLEFGLAAFGRGIPLPESLYLLMHDGLRAEREGKEPGKFIAGTLGLPGRRKATNEPRDGQIVWRWLVLRDEGATRAVAFDALGEEFNLAPESVATVVKRHERLFRDIRKALGLGAPPR